MWQIVQAWPFPWGPRGGGDFPYKGLWTGRARGVSIPILKTWCGAEVGVFGAEPVAVQSLSHVRLSVTPRTAAHQTSLSFTISWSLLRFMSTESVMPSTISYSQEKSLTSTDCPVSAQARIRDQNYSPGFLNQSGTESSLSLQAGFLTERWCLALRFSALQRLV